MTIQVVRFGYALVWTAISLFPPPTMAGEDDDPAATCILEDIRYRVEPEGRRATVSSDMIYAIHKSDPRIDPLRTVSLFNSFPAEVKKVDVYIWNTGGLRYRKRSGDFQDAAFQDGDIFISDRKYLVLQLPPLHPGDTLRVRDETILDPFLGFPLHTFAAREFPVRKSVYEATLPRELDPKYRTWNDAGEPQTEEEGKEITWRWTFEDPPEFIRETLGPDPPDVLPGVSIGVNRITWGRADTWESLGAAYWDRAREQLEPVSNAGLPARSEHHASSFDLALERIQNNIRYVAIHLGEGGLIPHSPRETIRKRYGDCKDMAALLVSLPELQSTEPAIALVQTRHAGAGFTIDPLPTLQFFNHAVACARTEAGIVWLDATHPYSTAANPRSDIQGAQALVLSGPESGFRRIRPNPPDSNRWIRRIRLRELESGAWLLEADFEWTGCPAHDLMLRHSRGVKWAEVLREDLERLECSILGEVTSDDIRVSGNPPDSVHIALSVPAGNPLERGPAALRPCWEREPFPLDVFATPERRADVHWPFLWTRLETLVVEPRSTKLRDLPDTSWAFTGQGLELRAGVMVRGGIVRFSRSFVVSNLVYPADRWQEAREARGRILRWSSKRLSAAE